MCTKASPGPGANTGALSAYDRRSPVVMGSAEVPGAVIMVMMMLLMMTKTEFQVPVSFLLSRRPSHQWRLARKL